MKHVIALGSRLEKCRNVITLGVRPNFRDYDPQSAALIHGAQKIYYPSHFYADLFDSAGIATFPGYHNYACAQDKIKQTALFNLLNIPHPLTHVFYGKRRAKEICARFCFPFIAKIARGSAMGRGVYLISNPDELQSYLAGNAAAYIQAYLPLKQDMRVVIIGGQIVHAYWRIAQGGEFRTNVAMGARISLDALPDGALALAEATARQCRWDDVGIDICEYQGKYYVLEANMRYGREGFRAAGIDYHQMMEKFIEDGII